jgi:hypothetical protein
MDSESQLTPRLINFIWICSGPMTGLSLVSYIAMKSAKQQNSTFEIVLHSNVQPIGKYWEAIKHFVSLRFVEPPDSVFGRTIERIQHKVDVLRIQILATDGGIYLDLDTICVAPLDKFLRSKVVMGEESDICLCNAFIAAPPRSEFLRLWYSEYERFHNDQWNNFSGALPKELATRHPELIDVEPKETFFWPDCQPKGLEDLFVNTLTFPSAHIFHLWGYIAAAYISTITLNNIFNRNSTYNVAAREVIGRDQALIMEGEAMEEQVTSTFLNALAEQKSVFSNIYDTSTWGRGSGNGSHPAATIQYRSFLENFISMNDISSIVDIGCGDWQSSQYISFHNSSYIGFDVVDSVVRKNNTLYANSKIQFQTMPDDPRNLPDADLFIMKDVLQHLTDEQIMFYRDYVLPKYAICLITNSWKAIHYGQNVPIEPGQFRSLDLKAAPYFYSGVYVVEAWNEWERIRTLLMTNPPKFVKD